MALTGQLQPWMVRAAAYRHSPRPCPKRCFAVPGRAGAGTSPALQGDLKLFHFTKLLCTCLVDCNKATWAVPQGDFGLSLFQDGILPAAFMVRAIGL